MTTPPPINPHDASLWDQRFEHLEPAYGSAPSLFLVEHADLYRPGQSALVPADGEGRNGLWLARRGLRVTCVDLSGVGLAKIQTTAKSEGLSVETVRADLLTWAWPEATYDHIVSIYFHIVASHRRNLHRSMARALVSGGHLLLEGFHPDQLGRPSGGPKDETMLFDETMLREDFEAMTIKVCRREDLVLEEGRLHRGAAVLQRVLAQRPGATPTSP